MTLYDLFQSEFAKMARSKGTGWCEHHGVTTKGEFIDNANCCAEVITRLALWLTTPIDAIAFARPWDLYQAGLINPEILKIKDEAHKRNKVDEKRWRLIWATAVAMEVLSRIFHGAQNEIEVAAYQAGYTHSEIFPGFGNAAGMGHHDKGLVDTKDALRRLLAEMRARRAKQHGGFAGDRKAWDMSLSRHMWVSDGRLRAILALAGGASIGFAWVQLKFALGLSAHVVLIGTTLYEVTTFGILGSGIFSTAISNGHINQLVNLDAFVAVEEEKGTITGDTCLRADFLFVLDGLSLTMGDDIVGRDAPIDIPHYVAHVKKLGITVTGAEKNTLPEVITDRRKVPFTSHMYNIDDDETGHPGIFDNFKKLAYRLALTTKKVTEAQAAGVLFACRWSPYLNTLKLMLDTFDPKLRHVNPLSGMQFDLLGFL
jgi:hypothetical protein